MEENVTVRCSFLFFFFFLTLHPFLSSVGTTEALYNSPAIQIRKDNICWDIVEIFFEMSLDLSPVCWGRRGSAEDPGAGPLLCWAPRFNITGPGAQANPVAGQEALQMPVGPLSNKRSEQDLLRYHVDLDGVWEHASGKQKKWKHTTQSWGWLALRASLASQGATWAIWPCSPTFLLHDEMQCLQDAGLGHLLRLPTDAISILTPHSITPS